MANWPNDIYVLWHWLLDKIEKCYGPDLVRRTLSLVAVSRYGLHPDEIVAIVAAREAGTFTTAAWSRMWMACSEQMLISDHEGVVRLSHSTLAQIISERYLEPEYRHDCHHLLADYFAKTEPAGVG